MSSGGYLRVQSGQKFVQSNYVVERQEEEEGEEEGEKKKEEAEFNFLSDYQH